MSLAAMLRREVNLARPEFRAANFRTQDELVRARTIRERLLAVLSIFFGAVALVLAGVGLYGVLNYAVTQRRRELGIRIALGAGAPDIVRRVTLGVLAMISLGMGVGLALGIGMERYIAELLFGVKATDPLMLMRAAIAILCAAALAALPAVVRAIRIDPATLLRAE
jgi:ABC-type antimicrobial peptide transport system permease subunit